MRHGLGLAAALLLASPGAATAGPALEHGVAVLQGLDKVTARVSVLELRIGEEIRFGSLAIRARACLETPPTEPPESAAFLEIDEVEAGDGPEAVFTGWMFASTPGISALEHPVYDVWVIDCAEPLAGDEPGTPTPAESPQ
ncbi:MAG TPA: DUF2155 domain-containing protein [Geminicoccaceae bacterium]|nr:DUF2155 domain-containing protein [Geminicoccaceae bacterium]